MESKFTNVGWIGTGIMGAPMCQHLMNKGYKCTVYTRTKSKAEDLLKNGAEWASPEVIAATCNPVFLMLGFPTDL